MLTEKSQLFLSALTGNNAASVYPVLTMGQILY